MIYSYKRGNRTYCTEAQNEEEAVIRLFNLMQQCPEDRKAFSTQPFELITRSQVSLTAEAQELRNGY
jgi:hypothetical protein